MVWLRPWTWAGLALVACQPKGPPPPKDFFLDDEATPSPSSTFAPTFDRSFQRAILLDFYNSTGGAGWYICIFLYAQSHSFHRPYVEKNMNRLEAWGLVYVTAVAAGAVALTSDDADDVVVAGIHVDLRAVFVVVATGWLLTLLGVILYYSFNDLLLRAERQRLLAVVVDAVRRRRKGGLRDEARHGAAPLGLVASSMPLASLGADGGLRGPREDANDDTCAAVEEITNTFHAWPLATWATS